MDLEGEIFFSAWYQCCLEIPFLSLPLFALFILVEYWKSCCCCCHCPSLLRLRMDSLLLRRNQCPLGKSCQRHQPWLFAVERPVLWPCLQMWHYWCGWEQRYVLYDATVSFWWYVEKTRFNWNYFVQQFLTMSYWCSSCQEVKIGALMSVVKYSMLLSFSSHTLCYSFSFWTVPFSLSSSWCLFLSKINYQYRNGTTFLQALKALYANGGLPCFYCGVVPALFQGPLSRFGDTAANTGVLSLLDNLEATQNMNIGFKTGAASMAAAGFWIFLMPIDTIKVRVRKLGAS